jgi:hypothetical protein
MMINKVMEEEDAFDDNVWEQLSIFSCLQNMHAAELKKRPRHRGSKPGKKKSKPRRGLEGHTMLYTNSSADGATHADNFQNRYRMSKDVFMEKRERVWEVLKAKARRPRLLIDQSRSAPLP